jgi:hypothetical protein
MRKLIRFVERVIEMLIEPKINDVRNCTTKLEAGRRIMKKEIDELRGQLLEFSTLLAPYVAHLDRVNDLHPMLERIQELVTEMIEVGKEDSEKIKGLEQIVQEQQKELARIDETEFARVWEVIGELRRKINQ